MKTLLSILLSVTMLQSAQARSVRPKVLSAKLTSISIDPKNEYLAQEKLTGNGYIVVNKTTRTITLQLERQFFCPPGLRCPQVMPEPVLITLKNLTVSHGFCGGTIYSASEDKRPVDGALQALSVMDNTTLNPACGDMSYLAPTEISYDTESGHMSGHIVKTHSEFTAEKLVH